jgi:hypothetical protein
MAEDASQRSYGCSYACGNPYDFVVVTVSDGSTLFLCVPCFVHTAGEMLEAMINPDNSEVVRKLREAGVADGTPMEGGGVKRRGHNAPTDTEDPDAIETFEAFVLPDELPDDF